MGFVRWWSWPFQSGFRKCKMAKSIFYTDPFEVVPFMEEPGWHYILHKIRYHYSMFHQLPTKKHNTKRRANETEQASLTFGGQLSRLDEYKLSYSGNMIVNRLFQIFRILCRMSDGFPVLFWRLPLPDGYPGPLKPEASIHLPLAARPFLAYWTSASSIEYERANLKRNKIANKCSGGENGSDWNRNQPEPSKHVCLMWAQ